MQNYLKDTFEIILSVTFILLCTFNSNWTITMISIRMWTMSSSIICAYIFALIFCGFTLGTQYCSLFSCSMLSNWWLVSIYNSIVGLLNMIQKQGLIMMFRNDKVNWSVPHKNTCNAHCNWSTTAMHLITRIITCFSLQFTSLWEWHISKNN